jgi:DNA-binding Lrp family transcriptional regulator
MNNLDDTDRELLAWLRVDARMPVATLAAKLKVARGTVQNRMKRLERDGVIVGYTVRVKPQAEAHRIRALMTIAVEGNRGAEVLRALRGHPNVTGLHQRPLGSGRRAARRFARGLRPRARQHPPDRRHREHRDELAAVDAQSLS